MKSNPTKRKALARRKMANSAATRAMNKRIAAKSKPVSRKKAKRKSQSFEVKGAGGRPRNTSQDRQGQENTLGLRRRKKR